MTKWHAHMAKHMNMVGGTLWWGALGPGPLAPPESGAVSDVSIFPMSKYLLHNVGITSKWATISSRRLGINLEYSSHRLFLQVMEKANNFLFSLADTTGTSYLWTHLAFHRNSICLFFTWNHEFRSFIRVNMLLKYAKIWLNSCDSKLCISWCTITIAMPCHSNSRLI